MTRPPVSEGLAIFGFAEFLAALALLVLVFSLSDFLYQFRVAVAPIPLRGLSFFATILIGAGTLLTDLWFSERWLALPWGISRGLLQGMFGGVFLFTVLLWLWFAFVRPPIFGKANYRRYYDVLFRTIVRGSDVQLAVLAAELGRSAGKLVELASPRQRADAAEGKPRVADLAHDALMLLSNRKLCRHIVSSSPITAIVLMEEAGRQKKYRIPLGGFARNVTTEALINRDSILFHEDIYGADVLGWVQPFSNAMYGNFRLVEGIAGPLQSPLDIDWRLAWNMDGEQFEVYCRITLLALKDYVTSGHYRSHSYVIYRALQTIGEAGRELYKLDGQSLDGSDSIAAKRLAAAAAFISEAIDFLGNQPDLDFGPLRRKAGEHVGIGASIFDHIAKAMFKLVYAASAVRTTSDNAWWIQYNILWSRIVVHQAKSAAWHVVRFKFFRLLFDEIRELEEFPNFKAARILGFCLNITGLSLGDRNQYRSEYRLQRAVVGWAKRNYLRLLAVHPPVAEHVLGGSISFDAENRRMVKTYAQGLSLEPSCSYLDLDEWPERPKVGRARRASKKS